MNAFKHPFLFLVAFLVGADEFLLGPILTPIGNDLGVVPERVTLFVTAYALPLALLAPLFGFLSDRHGRLAVLLPSTAVFALASVLTGFVSSFEWGIATRALTGVASAGMLPIAFALAADESEEAAKSIAFVMSGLTTGLMAGPGLGAYLTELWSWRAAFVALGLAALAVGAIGPAVLRNGRRPERQRRTGPGGGRLLVPGTVGSLCGMFFGLGGAVGIYSLVGERLRDGLYLDTQQVGLVYVGFGVLSVAGNALAPAAIRRIGGGRRAMRLAMALVIVCLAVVFALPDPALLAVVLALGVWAVAGGIGAPGLEAHIAGLSQTHRGVLLALSTSAANLGVALSAALAGEAYLRGSLWVAGLGFVLLSISVMALARPRGAASATENAG
ncbi:MFS transporter [Nitratireductor pacificus pht-3B]|uniref:MFS transporter n=2 Tax=Nitratireductor TaxID=245876 RepID=K2M928_9HYPH|nr:MFS transporter [Nitratireductor pacificus pht-3B]